MSAVVDRVEIRPSSRSDAAAYLEYMVRNRAWLEPFEPIRDDDHYTLESVLGRVQPTAQRCLYVAVLDEQIVAQAMLANFARSAFQSATLGYSVDQEQINNGIATRLVRHVVHAAFTVHGLHRVEAGTLLDNFPSQRVLEKSGFHRIGISPRHVKIAGHWQDHVLFAITAEDLHEHDR